MTPHQKMTPEKVAFAAQLYRDGLSISQIARELKVAPSLVHRWLHRYKVPMRPDGGMHGPRSHMFRGGKN
jgi:transposase-like protein